MAVEPTGPECISGWYKSTYSGGEGDCVEVAGIATGKMAVRDSKEPGGPKLDFGVGAWQSFMEQVKRGRLSAGM